MLHKYTHTEDERYQFLNVVPGRSKVCLFLYFLLSVLPNYCCSFSSTSLMDLLSQREAFPFLEPFSPSPFLGVLFQHWTVLNKSFTIRSWELRNHECNTSSNVFLNSLSLPAWCFLSTTKVAILRATGKYKYSHPAFHKYKG